jgi:hypothetical protein
MAATRASLDDLTIESEETLRWWNSTDEMQYGFCSECGGTVFWRSSEQPDSMAITAGTLDKPTGLRTTKAYFAQYASDYHPIDNTLETPDWPDGLGG